MHPILLQIELDSLDTGTRSATGGEPRYATRTDSESPACTFGNANTGSQGGAVE